MNFKKQIRHLVTNLGIKTNYCFSLPYSRLGYPCLFQIWWRTQIDFPYCGWAPSKCWTSPFWLTKLPFNPCSSAYAKFVWRKCHDTGNAFFWETQWLIFVFFTTFAPYLASNSFGPIKLDQHSVDQLSQVRCIFDRCLSYEN